MCKGSVTIPAMLLSSVFFLMLVTVDQANALNCWRCSSDSSQGGFCADPFNEDATTPDQRRLSYVECAEPPNTPHGKSTVQEAVCKKMHQLVNNHPVISRSCIWQDVGVPSNHCQTAVQSGPSYVKMVMCQTCKTDGCNALNNFAVLAPADIAMSPVDVEAPVDNSAAISGELMGRSVLILASLIAGAFLVVQ